MAQADKEQTLCKSVFKSGENSFHIGAFALYVYKKDPEQKARPQCFTYT